MQSTFFSNAARTGVLESPSDAARTEHFKLALSLPGKNIGGEWLCLATNSAMAYQSYCGTGGSPRVFTWYTHTDGLMYLEDQDGHWLSWESTANCLYMSYWNNAAAWKIEGGRLIRVKDGAVVSRPEKQSWPLANQHFLMALAPSEWALDVRIVYEPMSAVDRLLNDLTPVVAKKRQKAENAPESYLYTTRTSPKIEDLATEQQFAGRTAAFFALRDPIANQPTVPVYLLKSSAAGPDAPVYRLALNATQEGFENVLGSGNAAPNFHAFESGYDRDYLVQVYEHAPSPQDTQRGFLYDFVADAHDDWSAGVPLFRVVTVAEAHKALAGSTGSQSARRYAVKWMGAHGRELADLFGKLDKVSVNAGVLDQYQKKTSGLPPIRYVSIGAGGHLGYGLGTVGVELGAIWPLARFGQVPAAEPLSDYSVEWVTFGLSGVDIGGSADVCAVGVWYGDLDQINGACNGVTVSLQYMAGISVNLLWDGTWQGANESAHPIGVTVVMTAGVEVSAGVFYNASATQFWNRRPDFPKI